MAIYSFVAQRVLGDPATSGRRMNIVSQQRFDLQFNDTDGLLGPPQPGETVSLDGGATFLDYEFLGFGEVRGDADQLAGFIRIDLGNGSYQTVALDMNADGDGVSNLRNGNSKLTTSDLDGQLQLPFPYPPACFTPGTLIDTIRGRVPVEALDEGDLVWTLDHGYQPLRGVAMQEVAAQGRNTPVLFDTGVIGNTEPLLVSPQHRMFLTGWQAELHFGEPEVLIPAIGMVNGTSIREKPGGMVTYVHLLFERHEIVRGGGALSESFFVGEQKLDPTGPGAELRRLFPHLIEDQWHSAALARPQVRVREAQVLRAA